MRNKLFRKVRLAEINNVVELKLHVRDTVAVLIDRQSQSASDLLQLLIIYYVVFASADVNKILVAVIAFGLNSAAYIAEVIRSGIMSVDEGQMEAGRSLGLSYGKTMRLIILPALPCLHPASWLLLP